MANRFWVGGGSSTSWAAITNTNWSATSGGSNNATVPGVSDVAIFDANSGVGNSVISASIAVQGLITTNYAGTITHNTGATLTLNTGSASTLILGANMTYAPASTTSLITITNTSGTADITSNGKQLAALTINGVAGTARLLDALRVDAIANSALTLTNGTFNANNFNVTTDVFSSTNSNVRTLTMGSGTWTIGATASTTAVVWNLATTTNLTFNVNTANIVIANNSLAGSRTFAGGALTYNNLTINANSNNGIVAISQSNTFANLSVGAGNSLSLPNAGTTIITNAPTLVGTQTSPILIYSGVAGASSASVISVASGAVTLTWGGLRDITGAGGAAFTATNTLNFGNNANWSISPPADAALTPASIAAAVWRDTVAADFTVALSVGKSVMNGVALGTGLKVDSFSAGAVQSIWDALTSALTTVGSVGKKLADWTIGTAQTGDSYALANGLSGFVAIKTDTAAIKLQTDNLPSDPADESLIIAATNSLATSIAALNDISAADVWNINVDGVNEAIKILRGVSAALLGKASGLGTVTPIYRNVPDTKDVITGTVDAVGNRSAVTLDLTP